CVRHAMHAAAVDSLVPGPRATRTREERDQRYAKPIIEAVVATMLVFQTEQVPPTRVEGRRFRTAHPLRIAGLTACVALSISSCSSSTEPTTESPATTTATRSAPKGSPPETIDLKAFQTVVHTAA